MLPDAIRAISRQLDDLSLWTLLCGINVWKAKLQIQNALPVANKVSFHAVLYYVQQFTPSDLALATCLKLYMLYSQWKTQYGYYPETNEITRQYLRMWKTRVDHFTYALCIPAVTVSWQQDDLLLWPGERRLIIMTSSFISNFPQCRMCRFSHNRSQLLFSGHFTNQISPLEAHKRR